MRALVKAMVGCVFAVWQGADVRLWAQQVQQKEILVGTTLSPGFDIGVDTSGGRTDWLFNEGTHFRMSYPSGQSWGVVFVAVWPMTEWGKPRPSMDFSAYRTLLLEMRAGEGAQEIAIGIKDAKQPDDGKEARVPVRLSSAWQVYAIPVGEFKGADLKTLYVVTEFVFTGNTGQTVYVRGIRFTSQAAPVIRAVASAASFQAGAAAGGWITIYGSDLAPVTRSWSERDFQGVKLPKVLDGTSVSIAERECVLAFISPTQINALAPFDLAEGQSPVVVKNAVGGSAAFPTRVNKTQPALFVFPAENGRYAAAVHADGEYVGKAGLLGAGVAMRPAKPGDVVLLYGTGFGQTVPPHSADELLAAALPLPDKEQLRVRLGAATAECLFAGAVAPGLYQFNVTIPNVPDGDQAVTIEYRGAATQQNVFLTVQR